MRPHIPFTLNHARRLNFWAIASVILGSVIGMGPYVAPPAHAQRFISERNASQRFFEDGREQLEAEIRQLQLAQFQQPLELNTDDAVEESENQRERLEPLQLEEAPPDIRSAPN